MYKDKDMLVNILIFDKGNRKLDCRYKYYTRYYTLIYGKEMYVSNKKKLLSRAGAIT